VTDPHEVDDALDLAIDRTIRAQDEFGSTPPADPAAVPKATVVVHRAEDVKELARDAEVRGDLEPGDGEPRPQTD